MVVQYLILAITLLLLLHDNLKIFDAFEQYKKVTFYVLIGSLFILGIINLVNEEKRESTLLEQTEKTYNKTIQIIGAVENSVTTLGEAKEEIIAIDSVISIVKEDMSGQLDLMDQAVSKSKELVSLEEMKFDSEKPNISITSEEFEFKFDTINNLEGALEIFYFVRNGGHRTAANVSRKILVIIGKKNGKYYVLYENGNENKFLGNILGDFKTYVKNSIVANFNDYNAFNRDTNHLILIIKPFYTDEATKALDSTRYIFHVPNYGQDEMKMHAEDDEIRDLTDSILKAKGINDFY
ncbi:hypothetical protein D2V08_00115 [Flagellimonas lutimaris]|uniref:Uncharacterized protein n=1 Tax=Flagellimonas lutimaris TaxID=475082 RepID=A0A3A1NH90_9FLAO|nr:hypothetical protein [Allomuricauda lutimaris]RIV38155.1 hypothetical protein D2V08_00115 [Allomuricauda lutimaris]